MAGICKYSQRLTAIKAYEIFKNRWAIEVTFKE
jgi:hypothetical protein